MSDDARIVACVDCGLAAAGHPVANDYTDAKNPTHKFKCPHCDSIWYEWRGANGEREIFRATPRFVGRA